MLKSRQSKKTQKGTKILGSILHCFTFDITSNKMKISMYRFLNLKKKKGNLSSLEKNKNSANLKQGAIWGMSFLEVNILDKSSIKLA